ncbi:MAG: hypothetical protein ACTTGJ_00145 [Clostridium sp.]
MEENNKPKKDKIKVFLYTLIVLLIILIGVLQLTASLKIKEIKKIESQTKLHLQKVQEQNEKNLAELKKLREAKQEENKQEENKKEDNQKAKTTQPRAINNVEKAKIANNIFKKEQRKLVDLYISTEAEKAGKSYKELSDSTKAAITVELNNVRKFRANQLSKDAKKYLKAGDDNSIYVKGAQLKAASEKTFVNGISLKNLEYYSKEDLVKIEQPTGAGVYDVTITKGELKEENGVKTYTVNVRYRDGWSPKLSKEDVSNYTETNYNLEVVEKSGKLLIGKIKKN